MKRLIDKVIFLGKQELTFRGHQQWLANDPSLNTGKFLVALKYLANYDDVIGNLLDKVEKDHHEIEEKK